MLEYLKNDICKLKPLFKIDYSKKQNIVSSVFFKMDNGGYKSFLLYLNGVRYINEYIKKDMPGFRLRLFIDKSIHSDSKIMKYLNELNIDLVLYNCPNFKSTKLHHKGLFGTMVRFFPMFNFPNNDAGIVLISDIDFRDRNHIVNKSLGEMNNYYKKIKKDIKNINFVIDGKLFILPTVKIISDDEKSFNIYINGGKNLNIKRFDRKIIVNFINEVEEMETLPTKYRNNKKLLNSNFIYGVDEYFLNYSLFPYIQKNKLSYAVRMKYSITDYIYFRIIMNEKKSEKATEEYENFFKTVLNFDMKKMSIEEAYKKMDRITYIENSESIKLSPKQEKVFYDIYEYFISVYGTEKDRFYNKEFLSIILSKEYIGIPYRREVIFYNSKLKNFVEKEFKLDPKIIKILKEKIEY